MKILIIHNYYQQSGGEDVVVAAERELLQKHGHSVRFYNVSNDSVKGLFAKITTALRTPYSKLSRLNVCAEIAEFNPDIVHVHNLFPLLTPSIYDACRDARVPLVQTLHNFRCVCPGALFLRKEKICEKCICGNPYIGAVYRCYRGSMFGSLAVSRMVEYHRRRNTWEEKVDCYIALTDFSKAKFVQAKFPADKIVVKPNFLDTKSVVGKGGGGYALFVGRLSQEKGVKIMLEAWERLNGKVPLKIVGDGPLSGLVAKEAERIPSIEWLGCKSRTEVLALMQEAMIMVFPSIWYEGFPMTILEAYSVGLPVIASNLGSMSSLIDHGRTGLHFQAGDPQGLAEQVEWALAHPVELARMRDEASADFNEKYNAEKNYQMLMNIYVKLIKSKKLGNALNP